jgi:hypothetical protein
VTARATLGLQFAVIALALCFMQGSAGASAFSLKPTPFPSGGVYVPTGDTDDGKPLGVYQALIMPGAIVATPVAPGIVTYDFNALFSPTLDPADAIAFGIGTMFSIEEAAGRFTTCWSYACSPDRDTFFPFFDAFDNFGPLVRTDPDTEDRDPGRQSIGTMLAIALGDGGFEITSFFDIFVEISIGDDQWQNVAGSIRYELIGDPIPETGAAVPEPGTLMLLGCGVIVAGIRKHLRRLGAREIRSAGSPGRA